MRGLPAVLSPVQWAPDNHVSLVPVSWGCSDDICFLDGLPHEQQVNANSWSRKPGVNGTDCSRKVSGVANIGETFLRDAEHRKRRQSLIEIDIIMYVSVPGFNDSLCRLPSTKISWLCM